MRCFESKCCGAIQLIQCLSKRDVHGRVLNSAGDLVAGATVHLQQNGASRAEAVADAKGQYIFSGLTTGIYVLIAEKAGVRSRVATLTISSLRDQPQVDLQLEGPRLPAPNQTRDRQPQRRPWNSQTIQTSQLPASLIGLPPAVMGRTRVCAPARRSRERPSRSSPVPSARARQPRPQRQLSPEPRKKNSAQLSAARPEDFEANHRLGEFYLRQGRYPESATLLKTAYEIKPGDFDNEYDLAQACEKVGDLSQARVHVQHLLASHDTADLHRLAGSIDEKLGDPLTAVHEYEQAVRMDPSEQNYFEWGSELLYHRAVWQAQAVFEQGVKALPEIRPDAHCSRRSLVRGCTLRRGGAPSLRSLRSQSG